MKVYTKSDYKNEWNGTTDGGQELPDGTYYYVIEFESGKTKTGWVYLIREN
jgi:gliding motility-associated-like protein